MYSYPGNMLICGISSVRPTLLKQCEKMIAHHFYSQLILLKAFREIRADGELLCEAYLYLSMETKLF